MSTVINTNLASLFAQNSLANAQNNLATSVQRLSSGLRINSAKDDAAGLSIAQNMQGQINGVSQSIRNLSDATNLLQVADSSLSSIQDMLLRMKQLTVQGYDGSLSASQKLNIVQELKDLNDEINATAQRTSFNGISLLTSGSSLDLVNTDIKSGASLSSQAVQVNTTSGLGAYSTLNDGANTKVGGNGQNSTYWLQLDPALSPKTPGAYTLSANGNNITLTGTFNGQAKSQTVSIMDAVGNPNGGQDKTIQQQLNFNNFGIKLNVSTVVGAGATETGTQLASAIVGRSNSIVVDGKGGQISNVRLSGANPGTYQLTYGNTGSVSSLSLPASLASGQTSAGQNSNVALVGGSGSGAKANVVYDANGNVTGVQIADAGTGYKAGDVLSTAAISAGTVQNASITSAQGGSAETEVANVQFHDIGAGQTMTLAGLTFTAGANGATATQLASAFANMTNGSTTGAGTQVINGSGSYSGVFNGWTTGAANADKLVATSVVANMNVADLQAGPGSTSPVVLTTSQGSAGAAETADTTFVGLNANQSFTLAGLTFTAGAAALTAQQVAQAFAGLADGTTAANANNSNSDREVAKGVTAGNAALSVGAATGTFTSGALTGWGTVGAIATSVNSAADTLTFTSSKVGVIADGSHLGQSLGGVPTISTTTGGQNEVTESASVKFSGIDAHTTVNLGGLMFTAGASALSSAQVAQAFAGLQNGATTGAGAAYGTYSGALNGYSTASASGSALDTVVFSSSTPNANVSDLVNPTAIAPNTAPNQMITTIVNGNSTTTEVASADFSKAGNLTSGQTLTIAGLTFTTGLNGATVAQVAAAFANLNNGDTGAALNSANHSVYGTFTGTFAGWNTGSVAADSKTVTFTSSMPNSNVTDLAVTAAGTAPTIAVTQGSGATHEVASVQFKDLAAGQVFTLGGLEFTARVATTKSDLANAFKGLTDGTNYVDANSHAGLSIGTSNGAFTGGVLSGWTAANAVSGSSDSMVFAASAVGNVANLTVNFSGNPTAVTKTVGSNFADEAANVTFTALNAGQTVTLAGLTYTAGANGASASDVAYAFGSLAEGYNANTGVAATNSAGVVTGTLTGKLSGWKSSGANSANVVAFTRWNSASSNAAPSVTTGDTAVAGAHATTGFTFGSMAAGEHVTVNGLDFTANKALSSNDVANAFWAKLDGSFDVNTNGGVGTFSGTWNAGMSTGWQNNVETITPTVVQAGGGGNREKDAVVFRALGYGQSVTVDNMIYTAGKQGASVADIEAAFKLLDATAGNVTAATANGLLSSTAQGTFSGSLSAGWKATAHGAAGTGVDFEFQTAGAHAAITASQKSVNGSLLTVRSNAVTMTTAANVVADTSAGGSREIDTITFNDLTAGSTVSLTAAGNTLQFTAGANGATASQIATLFATYASVGAAPAGAVNDTATAITGRMTNADKAIGTFTSGTLFDFAVFSTPANGVQYKATANLGNGVNTFTLATTLAGFQSTRDARSSIGAPVVTTIQAGGNAQPQQDLVSFVDLSAGSSVTIAGLTYTAGANGASAHDVASAFAGLSYSGTPANNLFSAWNTSKTLTDTSNGKFTAGSLLNVTTVANGANSVNFNYNANGAQAAPVTNNTGTSILQNATDLAAPLAGTAPTIATVQQGGSSNSTEAATVSFGSSNMSAGDSITVGGLTFTASQDGVTQAQVAQLFAGLNDGQQGSGISTQYGTFTGQLSGWNTGAASGGSVVFTSTTPNSDVADLTSNVTQRKSLNALSGIVVGNLANQTGDNLLTISGMVGGRMTTQSLSLSDNKANGSQTINFDSFGIQFDVDSFQAQSANEIGAALASLNTSSAVNGSTGAFKPGQIVVGQGANSALKFQSGANTDAYIQIDTINVQTGTDGVTAGTDSAMINVGTRISGSGQGNLGALGVSDTIDTWQTAFKNAADAVDQAVEYISTKRATYGSQMNRLSYISTNLTAQSTNLQNSRSAIMDTDFASETAKLTKGQIMQQAATAMLAQANQMPNVILSLLK